MAQDSVSIASRAAVMVGLNPISSFENADTESIAARELYDGVKEECLTDYPWRFAMKQRRLDLLPEEPVGRWDRAYELPSDILVLRAITVGGERIPYDRYGDNLVYTDTSVDDVLIADYMYAVSEMHWPPYFARYVEYKMAATLALTVTMKSDLAEAFTQKAQMQFNTATRMDAQAQTINSKRNRISTSRLIGNRARIA